MVLGLLNNRPMHGYEIQQYLEVTQSDTWAGILPGSIYHALKKMASEGLLEVQRIEQTGHRTRAVYAITESGRAEFKRLLREAWRTPCRVLPSSLYAAISFVDELPRAEVLEAIDEQIAALEQQLAQWNAGEEAKKRAAPFPLPDYSLAAFQNGRDHMEADLRFLRRLRDSLPMTPRLNLHLPPIKEDGEP
jgi:DNA-binding PadR family transcriptional regulator